MYVCVCLCVCVCCAFVDLDNKLCKLHGTYTKIGAGQINQIREPPTKLCIINKLIIHKCVVHKIS